MNYEILLYEVLAKAPKDFRANYLFREYKKAELEYYTKDEFFSSCYNVLNDWQEAIKTSHNIALTNLFQKENKIYMAKDTDEQQKRALAQLEIERKATTIDTMAIAIIEKNKFIGSVKLNDVKMLVEVVKACSNMIKKEMVLSQKQAAKDKEDTSLSQEQAALLLYALQETYSSEFAYDANHEKLKAQAKILNEIWKYNLKLSIKSLRNKLYEVRKGTTNKRRADAIELLRKANRYPNAITLLQNEMRSQSEEDALQNDE